MRQGSDTEPATRGIGESPDVNRLAARSRLQGRLARVAAGSALGSGLSGLALLLVPIFQRSAESQDRSFLVALFNLLLVPAAVYFWWRLGRELPLTLSTAFGVASLLLWAVHHAVRPIGFLEPVWIWLAALWWLGLGIALRPAFPRLGLFTVILSLAATLDAIVSSNGLNPPFLLFALLGAWKIPLSFLWAFAVAVTLIGDSAFKAAKR